MPDWPSNTSGRSPRPKPNSSCRRWGHSAHRSAWLQTQQAQQHRHRQPLHDHRKGDDTERSDYDFVANRRAELRPARQGWCRSALPWSMDLTQVERFERQP